MESERIFTETPKQSLWDRIEVLTTFNGVKAVLLRRNAELENKLSERVIEEKSKGIVFCVRSAKDMFMPSSSDNPTPRLINLYYGVYNLLCALLVSDIANELTLADIEMFSKSGGHGLKTIYSDNEHDIENSEFIYACNNGFFPSLLKHWKYNHLDMTMSKNFKRIGDIVPQEKRKLVSLKDLLSRIPELRNIYVEIFQEQPNYIHYHANWHPDNGTSKLTVPIFKNSKFLQTKDINRILGLDSKYAFQYKKDNYSEEFFCDNEIPDSEISRHPEYHSPLSPSVTIHRINGLNDPFLINFKTLYMLSIWTRYRPNLWRKICDGEHDHFRALFNIYIDSIERVMPNLFLDRFYGRSFVFASHSYWS